MPTATQTPTTPTLIADSRRGCGDGLMPMILTHRQKEMLRLTVEAGVCINLIPSVYHAAWTVRTGHHGGIEREFSQKTGDGLLRLGFIELAPDNKPPSIREHGDPFVMRRYKPTEKGVALIETWKTESRFAAAEGGDLAVTMASGIWSFAPVTSRPPTVADSYSALWRRFAAEVRCAVYNGAFGSGLGNLLEPMSNTVQQSPLAA